VGGWVGERLAQQLPLPATQPRQAALLCLTPSPCLPARPGPALPRPLQSIAQHVGVSGSVDQLCRDPKVTKELLAQLTATAKEGKLKVRWGRGGVGEWVNGRACGWAAAWLPGGQLMGSCLAARRMAHLRHLPIPLSPTTCPAPRFWAAGLRDGARHLR
jgi:hypothetical protein